MKTTAPNYQEALESALGVPFAAGNRIRILQNGDEIFPAMLKAIQDASRSIDFVTFVYWKGDIADKFAKTLAARATAGVKVRVLLDAFGSKTIADRLIEQMAAAGVEIRWFRPLFTWRIWRNDKRTHRKILIVDEQLAFTGGVGIAREWEGDARTPNEWRETHFSIDGPAIRGLKAAFLDNWNEAGDWTWDGETTKPPEHSDGYPVQVISASSTVGWSDTAALLRALISLSVKRLRIVTPYFVPDHRLTQLLCTAAEHGVAIDLMIPGKYCDMRLPQLAGQQSIETLLRAGIRVWRYQKTNLHAKLLMIDGAVACIGSANLNHRSIGKDEECCAVVLSKELTMELEAAFDDDCKACEAAEIERWQARGYWTKTKERFARLILEQL